VWPLCSSTARLLFLRALCAVAEGADVSPSHTVPDAAPSSRCPPDVCVAVVLGDALHRVSVLGGREDLPRSLGSVYGGTVTRFLGGSLRGVVSRVVDTPGVSSWSNGVAVSRDGSSLLVADSSGRTDTIHVFRVADGLRLRVIGKRGGGPLQFNNPRQVWIASDDHVFVADMSNHRVQVLTPTLDFHAFVGVGQLNCPSGVCADDDVVVVSEGGAHRISVFNRGDGALLRRFGSCGGADGQLVRPHGLCFMSGQRHVAVADNNNHRVSVFSVDGEFIRHVGIGSLNWPLGLISTACDELVVADCGSGRAAVFSGSGELVMSMGRGLISGVALHGSTVFVQDRDDARCVAYV
jgi:DNA-binding beta-propeller fold protein YncE